MQSKESNNLRFSNLGDIQFSASKGVFSEPRPNTHQVGSRYSSDTKNTKIYVLGAENCKMHRALNYLVVTFGPQKTEKKGFLAKFGSPQFGQKCFWNTQGVPVNM